MTRRVASAAPALVAGATVALAVTAASLALVNVGEPGELVADNRTNTWLAGLSMGVLGALVLHSQRGNRLGAVLSAAGIAASVAAAAIEYAAFSFQDHAGNLPATVLAVWLASTMWVPPFLTMLAALPLLFPDGRLASRRWRWPARAALVGGIVATVGFATSQAALDDAGYPQVANPLDLPLADDIQLGVVAAGFVTVAVVGGAAVVGIALRMRRADARRRQQYAWFVAAVALGGPAAFLPTSPLVGFAFNTASVVCLGVGIVRHGMFDIEVALSRTVVYTILTAAALGAYFAAAALLGAGTDVGVGPTVVAAIVALLLASGRQRLQAWVEHAMYGARRDPLAALTDLGDRLDAALDVDDVLPATVDAVRRTLNLPYAEVRLDGEEGPACASGTPPDRTVQFPLEHAGEQVGALVVGLRRGELELSAVDARLLDAFARQAGVAAHGVRAARELRRSRERVVMSREEERRRIRRDLHDGLGPALAGISLGLETAARTVERNPVAATSLMGELREDTAACVDEVRRIVSDLRPPALDDAGLAGALRRQADLLTARADGHLVVSLEDGDLPSLSPAVEVAAYRIATEAITNATRHAGASTCRITISYDGVLHITVVDDGTGEPPAVAGTGLTSMRERAEELGGTCTVTFRRGSGTRVEALLPTQTVTA